MTKRDLQRPSIVAAVLAAAALAAPLAGQAGTGVAPGGCTPADPGVNCGPGNNRTTGGGAGAAKVPHNDGAGHKWPALSGILWQVLDTKDRTKFGGPKNDELLGHHGDETLVGAGGDDIIWGDWDPKGNTTKQRETLSGGDGNDWLYPSHGRTTVRGGAGRDYVWAYYGKGTIDCGPGVDTARVRTNGAFKLHNCEKVRHFCAHGENSKGQCLSPTGNPVPAAQRWG
jgi:Ca2+-binding RTX toxin-like protein